METVVVVAILVVMSGAMLLLNGNSGTSLEVQNAAEQVMAQLMALQNESLAGQKVEKAGVRLNACSFKFSKAASGDAEYEISYYTECSANPNAANLIRTMPKVKLKGVKLSINGGPVVYRSPHGITNAATIDIVSLKDDSKTAQLVISASGNIEKTITN